MAFPELVFAHPGPNKAAVAITGLCLLIFLFRSGIPWRLAQDGVSLAPLLALAAFFAFAFFREPKAVLGRDAMDYTVENSLFPFSASERVIPYASVRKLTEAPWRRNGPAVRIEYEEAGRRNRLRIDSGELDGVDDLAGELSRRSGVKLDKRWTL